MKIFRDKISGDELFSDTYKINDFNEIFYQVEGAWETRKDTLDESKFGFNASAEEAGEDNEEGSESGINVVINHKLQPTCYSNKKNYISSTLKPYLKKIKQMLVDDGKPDEAAQFEKEAAKIGKDFIIANYDEFEFFCGESMDTDAMVVLVDWRDVEKSGKTVNAPFLYFFKQGLIEEKV